MSARISLYLAQMNPLVGDIDGNTQEIVAIAERARHAGADLVIYPELAVTGYPPEDLLLRPSLLPRVARSLQILKQASRGLCLVVGYPASAPNGKLYNAAGVFRDGELVAQYHKQCLPNYQVFDEHRYFISGQEPVVFEHRGIRFGLSICEDIWNAEPTQRAVTSGAQVLLSLNASPFDAEKHQEREVLISHRAKENGVPIVYLNQVGGQDELVFDGASMIVDASGVKQLQAPMFEVSEKLVDLCYENAQWKTTVELPQSLHREAMIYAALVLGVKDYVTKNRFKGVVLGLSGGIDSALTLAIAVDALGANRVEAVMMPFRYTSEMSRSDASEQAQRLGVVYRSITIEPMYDAFMAALACDFSGLPVDTTEQNLQARCRGNILMAISNKLGSLVLTTGNKSEMAVGYATLYGDMAGGLDVLKDVPKTLVYRLAEYRNSLQQVIPQRVIERPPSAELAPNQKDSDNLPPYDILDAILYRYIDQDQSAADIIDAGFDSATVHRVIRLVDLNEYKRRQAAIGIRISRRGFGRDRRYPITNGWKAGD